MRAGCGRRSFVVAVASVREPGRRARGKEVSVSVGGGGGGAIPGRGPSPCKLSHSLSLSPGQHSALRRAAAPRLARARAAMAGGAWSVLRTRALSEQKSE